MLPQERARRVVDELKIGFVENRWALTQSELKPNLDGAVVLTEHRLLVGLTQGRSRQVIHLGVLDFMSEILWDKNQPEAPYQAVFGHNHDVSVVVQTANADEHESTMLSDLLNEAFVQLKQR